MQPPAIPIILRYTMTFVAILRKEIMSVAEGKTYTEAAKLAGRRFGDAVAEVVGRFNQEGLNAIEPGWKGIGRQNTVEKNENGYWPNFAARQKLNETGRRRGR
jgi:hypothetical protein